MEFIINKNDIQPMLKAVVSVSTTRDQMNSFILSHFLIQLKDGKLRIRASDLEIEAIVSYQMKTKVEDVEFTVPAKTLVDICSSFPNDSNISFEVDSKKDQLVVRSGNSRFSLKTLIAGNFPCMDYSNDQPPVELSSLVLRRLIENTQFSIAQNDVRYYLNGLLLQFSGSFLKLVATDGHRLALDKCDTGLNIEQEVILPRKCVQELLQYIKDDNQDKMIEVQLGTNHIQFKVGDLQIISKLIDGKFPDYQKVIPDEEGGEVIYADRENLYHTLKRASILSDSKHSVVKISLKPNSMNIKCTTLEKGTAEEEIKVSYEGKNMDIGFNVFYILDILQTIKSEEIKLRLTDPNSSCLIIPKDDKVDSRYVVMPMKL